MVERKSWEEFRDCGLLWWVNRILHTFGWSIVVTIDDQDNLIEIYPARVKFRGFSEEVESRGFIKVTEHISQTIKELEKEAKS